MKRGKKNPHCVILFIRNSREYKVISRQTDSCLVWWAGEENEKDGEEG
jgi:hypothetical protein